MQHSIRTYSLSALSAILLTFCFPPFRFGGVSWVALVPMLLALHRVPSAKESAAVCAFAGLLFYSFTLHWFGKIFGFFAIGFYCLLAIFWAIFGFFYFKFSTKEKIFFAPLLWVGLEFFRSEIWYFEFPWLSLGSAHSHDFFSSTLQMASLWGVYGNSFLIFFTNGLFSEGILNQNRKRKIILFLFGFLIPLVFVSFCAVRLTDFNHPLISPSAPKVKVLLVQSETFNLDDLIEKTLESKFKNGVVVWPEYQVPILPGERLKKESYEKISEVARKTESLVVAGCAEFLGAAKESKGREKIYNYAVLFDSSGALAGIYTKRHPIPLLEKFFLIRGKSSEPVSTLFGKMGIAICYDMDFSETFVRLCRNKAEMVLVPSLDPERWGIAEHLQHAALAPVRAVESRRWIVRACSSGPSQIVSPDGVEVKTKYGGATFLEGSANLAGEPSFYHKWFWLFPWFCFGLSCLMMIKKLFVF